MNVNPELQGRYEGELVAFTGQKLLKLFIHT